MQVRAADESWRQALVRSVVSLRADNVAAQGMRFVFSGVVVSIIYITVTTLLATVAHLRFEVALALGWCASVAVHFTLQRTFVWVSEKRFALAFGPQVRRYLLVAVSQLAVTTLTTSVLPSALRVSTELVYLATGATLTLINFLVFRNRVFHPGSASATLIAAPGVRAVPPPPP